MSLSGSPPRWAPTHVQVTVLRARGLRPKAKGAGGGGGSDAYALMALGKEKFATSVAERCLGAPVWREEATFELPPRRPGHGGEPALQLTVLHRALLGLDKFLGRAEVSLAGLQEEGGRRSTRWYTLHSKPGKKEKERGEIEVDIQFMRSNMTASMFDLSMKDKSRSPFGKLKGKLKGKRANGLPDTASAIIPSITHSPADSEEESSEKEKKKFKIKTLFSKPGLQKTSLSQSMSVLPAFQPVTEKVRLKPGDFQSNWGEDDDSNSEKAFGNKAEDNSLHVPVLMAHKRTASADNKQLNEITSSNTKKEGLSLFSGLKSKNDPTPRSNVCINGNHVYQKESETKKETMPKDNTPSSSPQTFRKNQPSESEENLSSKSTKEHEKTGRVSPSRGLSGSPSLESFKSMTLPSYKLLSGGDLVGNSASLSLETAKEETKEDKNQENKKSLLSLVTGRKEVVKNNDVENMSDMTLKEREAKLLEEKKNEKDIKPVEIPKDYNQESTPKNSNTADVPRNKKSHNPFDESLMDEQKPEKSAASARTIQTKAVKPSSSQLSPSSSSLQSGACNNSRAESVKKPPAESFNHKVENAGKKKVLQAWVSPSETLPNQTQQSGGSVSVKHRPHPVKPMNTTANKLQTKNLTTTTKMDENWTESNRKKYDPSDPAYAYAQLTHDELIQLVLRQKDTITKRDLQVRELENYIDNLLVRVMEETPNILRAPSPKNMAGRM
ncbi:rab11 family-interacting protein 1 isoform X2 [Chelonia mydas]|uniref:rab11 family-interacting protein 1 isoform X2 n=1 Tax=Chelonia mydas TaxID=8469 RepID=UPI001CA8457B|nr:rab11 family-interacting protein 1 isoform X2 [Chelonia mydas]